MCVCCTACGGGQSRQKGKAFLANGQSSSLEKKKAKELEHGGRTGGREGGEGKSRRHRHFSDGKTTVAPFSSFFPIICTI